MPRPTSVTVSSQAASAWIPLDRHSVHKTITCDLTGTLTYSVELTNDDLQDSTVTPVAFAQASGKSADYMEHLDTPATGIRVNVTAFTSGSVKMTVTQG